MKSLPGASGAEKSSPEPIPLIRANGSYREVGEQIGAQRRAAIRRSVDFDHLIPRGLSRTEFLRLASPYLDVTVARYPWVVDELDGVARSAGVPLLDLFTCLVEEIWHEPWSVNGTREGGCTDFVFMPSTTGGSVLVAHNNDLDARHLPDIVAIERRVTGDPVVLTIGNGIWISTGWNSAGLSLTGNNLNPIDERIGVPREIQMRAMLRAWTVASMLEVALDPDRASSYNHVMVSSDGSVVDVEGSATDHRLLDPVKGTLVHANHYQHPEMERMEADPLYARASRRRFARACAIATRATRGRVDVAVLKGLLSDHVNGSAAVCRHEQPARSVRTVFWCVADVTRGSVTYGRGNPCKSTDQTYRFAEYPQASPPPRGAAETPIRSPAG